MNVIARLGFELAYYDIAVHCFDEPLYSSKIVCDTWQIKKSLFASVNNCLIPLVFAFDPKKISLTPRKFYWPLQNFIPKAETHCILFMAIISINRHQSYRWVVVVSRLNCLILAFELWGSSTQHQVKHTANLLFESFALLHIHHAAPGCSILLNSSSMDTYLPSHKPSK